MSLSCPRSVAAGIQHLSDGDGAPRSPLLNVAGFFGPLLAWVDHCVAEGFIRPEHRALLQVAGEPRELLEMLARYRTAASTPKWIGEGDR